MPEDSVEFTLHAPMGRESKKYKVKYARWVADMIAERESRDAHGEIDTLALWIKRLTRDITDSTGIPLSEDQIRKMERWESNGLILCWFKVNEVPAESFLEDLPKDEKGDSTSISS